MKFGKFLVLSTMVLAVVVGTSNKGQAVGLVLNEADLVTPPAGANVIELCDGLQLCEQGDVQSTSVPAGTSSRYVVNDTDFDVNSLVYTILPGQDAQWDPASAFSFFNASEITADGKTLTFSDGVWPAGETGIFTRTTDTPFTFSSSLAETTPIPEPLHRIWTKLARGSEFSGRQSHTGNSLLACRPFRMQRR